MITHETKVATDWILQGIFHACDESMMLMMANASCSHACVKRCNDVSSTHPWSACRFSCNCGNNYSELCGHLGSNHFDVNGLLFRPQKHYGHKNCTPSTVLTSSVCKGMKIWYFLLWLVLWAPQAHVVWVSSWFFFWNTNLIKLNIFKYYNIWSSVAKMIWIFLFLVPVHTFWEPRTGNPVWSTRNVPKIHEIFIVTDSIVGKTRSEMLSPSFNFIFEYWCAYHKLKVLYHSIRQKNYFNYEYCAYSYHRTIDVVVLLVFIRIL